MICQLLFHVNLINFHVKDQSRRQYEKTMKDHFNYHKESVVTFLKLIKRENEFYIINSLVCTKSLY